MAGYHGVRAHHRPFLPYIEKTDSSPLDEEWVWPSRLTEPIKIDTLKTWISTCDNHHSPHCSKIEVTDPGQRPLWLVDVRRQCIVRGEVGHTYVALSYVWGKAECTSLTTETLETLPRERSLAKTALPRTIREAMDLVANLDLQYLWVDRLCIVQDNDVEKHAQIKVMGSIYAQAYFTIIAAQSHDATGGLSSRPVRLASSNKSLTQTITTALTSLLSKLPTKPRSPHTTPFGPWTQPQTNLDVLKIMAVDILRTIWFSRGWTFQEFLFSRRRLVFHNNTVNWECHCAAWHERQSALAPLAPCPRPTPQPLSLDAWPNFHRYARLAALFSIRHFTYPEDVLDAFAGAAAAFAHLYPGGLVTGLPAMVFDAALVWQPYHPLVRRSAAVVGQEEAVLPSWSWMSWLGNVHSENWQSGWDYLRREADAEAESGALPRWSTFSTVQWSCSETLEGERRRIPVRAAEWQQMYEGTDAAPPEGWRRCVEAGSGERYFTHDNIPGYEFWYPIPMNMGPAPASRARFLHGRTRKARLAVDAKTYRSFGTGCAVAALLDPEGGFAGCLRLNEQVSDRQQGFCEVIELSSGSVALGDYEIVKDHPLVDVFDEWTLPGWDHQEHTEIYRFLNVMQIEWKDDVTFRLAVGRVPKDVWDNVPKDEVDIIIG